MAKQKRNRHILRDLKIDEISVVDKGAGDSCVIAIRKLDDDSFRYHLDTLVKRYKADIDLAFAENIDNPSGFHRACSALRGQFDADIAEAKRIRLAKLGLKPKAKRDLTSPGLAEREADRRYRDNASTGMRTPGNPDTGLSEGGFDLRTTGCATGDEDEPDAEPDDDDDDDQDHDDAFEQLSRKAKKLAKRTGVSEAVAFSTIYEDPRYSDIVAATKRPVVRVEKSAQDAFAELMAQSEQAYAAGKYPTAAVAFEKMLCASDVMLRESVKRARGST